MNPNKNINFVDKKKTKTLKPVKEEKMSGSKTRKSNGQRRNPRNIMIYSKTDVLVSTIKYVLPS